MFYVSFEVWMKKIFGGLGYLYTHEKQRDQKDWESVDSIELKNNRYYFFGWG